MRIRRRENRASAKRPTRVYPILYTRNYLLSAYTTIPPSLPSSRSYTLLTSVRRHTIHPTLNRPRRVQYALIVLRNVGSEPISKPANGYFICFPVIRWRARARAMGKDNKNNMFSHGECQNDFCVGMGSDGFYAQIESGGKHGGSTENVKIGMKSIDER